MNLLTVNKISYKYDTQSHKDALADISLNINKGEFVGLIGHTGSGKSTLIQMFNGLLKPTEGEVLYRNQNIWDDDFKRGELRCKIAMVFQYPDHQLFEETIIKDVMFGPSNQGLDLKIQEERAINALNLVGIKEDLFYDSPFDLSGGQKRRVAIAGALAMQPEILVLDEPTAGLDPAGRTEILDQIKKLQVELGLSVILVSHSMNDVAKYTDRLWVLNDGRLIYDDKPSNVFRHKDSLEKMGLKAPDITYILSTLKDKGLDVDPSIINIDLATDNIYKNINHFE